MKFCTECFEIDPTPDGHPLLHDPSDLVDLTDDPRRQALARLIDQHRIRPNCDYEWDDLVEDLTDTEPLGRWVSGMHDETYTFLATHTTLEAACRDIAVSLGDDTGGSPLGIWDLDAVGAEGLPVFHQVDIVTTVTLKEKEIA